MNTFFTCEQKLGNTIFTFSQKAKVLSTSPLNGGALQGTFLML